MDNKKEATVLFAEKEIEVNGEVLLITPFTWHQSSKIVTPITVLAHVIVNNIDKIDESLKDMQGKTLLSSAMTMLELFSKMDSEKIISALTEIIAVALKKPINYVENLMIDDVVVVLMAVYDVNKTFFTNCLSSLHKNRLASKA